MLLADQEESKLYQFWVHEHVEACDTVYLLELDRSEDSPRGKSTHDEALLLMEATFGPLNGSVVQHHDSSRDTRYRAMLPPALLAAFGLSGSQPLSALSGPLKTVPLNSAIPTRAMIGMSPNHAPRLLRGTVVARNGRTTGKYPGGMFCLSRDNKEWRLAAAIYDTMIAKGWSIGDSPFLALDFHELRPHYEHAGHVGLQLFYYAGHTSTIESVWLPYESLHRPHEYHAAMAAQTLYEAAQNEVIPSNRRLEFLSGIDFEGHKLGPEVYAISPPTASSVR
ncbi:hypothetical protein LTR15_000513 [Elasticomyces elasticus]|nr:hypothetical protein LTR15_000513 [Elasticomyces elasticus]